MPGGVQSQLLSGTWVHNDHDSCEMCTWLAPKAKGALDTGPLPSPKARVPDTAPVPCPSAGLLAAAPNNGALVLAPNAGADPPNVGADPPKAGMLPPPKAPTVRATMLG